MNISVIVVFYDGLLHLEECLGSIADQVLPESASAEVILVDVSSSGRAAELAEQFGARYLWQPENRGYGWALNRGFAQATGDVIVFSNPDLWFDRDALHVLAEESLASGGIVAPSQYDADSDVLVDSNVLPFGFAGAVAKWLALGRNGRRRRELLDRIQDADAGPVALPKEFAMSGACLAMTRSTRDLVGEWDERFFLYFEDADMSLRAHRAGLSLIVCPSVAVHHHGGWKERRQRPRFSDSSSRSERLLWAKHGLGPSWLVICLQRLGCLIRAVGRG